MLGMISIVTLLVYSLFHYNQNLHNDDEGLKWLIAKSNARALIKDMENNAVNQTAELLKGHNYLITLEFNSTLIDGISIDKINTLESKTIVYLSDAAFTNGEAITKPKGNLIELHLQSSTIDDNYISSVNRIIGQNTCIAFINCVIKCDISELLNNHKCAFVRCKLACPIQIGSAKKCTVVFDNCEFGDFSVRNADDLSLELLSSTFNGISIYDVKNIRSFTVDKSKFEFLVVDGVEVMHKMSMSGVFCTSIPMLVNINDVKELYFNCINEADKGIMLNAISKISKIGTLHVSPKATLLENVSYTQIPSHIIDKIILE